MRRILSFAAMLIVSGCNAAYSQSADPDRPNDRSEILSSINEISTAYVSRDPAPFEKIYLENFVYVREKPLYNFREQLIAMMRADSLILRARKKPEFDTLQYDTQDPQIRFYGSTAVLNIVKRHVWQYNGQKCWTRSQGTELWVRRESGWRIAAVHASFVHCDQKPSYQTHAAVAAIEPNNEAPAISDSESEQQIREIINSVVRARITPETTVASVLDRSTVKDFTVTNLKGEVSSDRTILESMPVFTKSRSAGFRSRDDAIVIYDNAGVYTYKVRPVASAAPNTDAPQQCSVFFAKVDGRWMIIAAQISRYSRE